MDWSHTTPERHNVGRFGFTATKEADLNAFEYTLIQIVVSVDHSTPFPLNAIERLIRAAVKASSPLNRRNNLMFRLLVSGAVPQEVHGFRLLPECDHANYCGLDEAVTSADLIDTTLNGIEALANYARFLTQRCYLANGILIVITDGMNNTSSCSLDEAKKALDQAVNGEDLESLTSLLVGICHGPCARFRSSMTLRQFKDCLGFTYYVELDDNNYAALLADFVSTMVSSVCHALGSSCLPSLFVQNIDSAARRTRSEEGKPQSAIDRGLP